MMLREEYIKHLECPYYPSKMTLQFSPLHVMSIEIFIGLLFSLSCFIPFTSTVEPRYNDPRYNDILGVTINMLCPGKRYSKMYGTDITIFPI